jgi:hypothetical protein
MPARTLVTQRQRAALGDEVMMYLMTDLLAGYVVPAGAGLAGDPGPKASRRSTGRAGIEDCFAAINAAAGDAGRPDRRALRHPRHPRTSPPMMEITLALAAGPGDRDRAWLTAGGAARRGPVHVIHDLPHLVVESLSGITGGLRAELAAGSPRQPARRHRPAAPSAASRAGSSPAPQPASQPASGPPPGTAGPRRSPTAWPTGAAMAPAPSGVRDRAARQHDRTLDDLLAGVDDQTIAMAIRGVQDLQERWMTVPPGRGAQAVLATGTRLVRRGHGKPATGR